MNIRDPFQVIAGRTRAGIAVAALLVPSWGTAAEVKSSAHPPRAGHVEPDVFAAAKCAKDFENLERDVWQKPDEVMSLLQLWPGNVVADIGATGQFEPHLAKAVGATGRVLALEVEPRVATCLKRWVKKEKPGNVTVEQVTAHDPRFVDGSVDRVLVVDSWHHSPRRPEYAAALNRVLRPGGFVVVVDFTAESPQGPPLRARLAPATVIAELEAGGFSARTVAESLPFQYVVIGQKRGGSEGRPTLTARQRALVDLIKANADRARFTRGVNAETVQILANAVAPTEDSELRALLYHDDATVTRTAASVFAARGDRGLAVLREVAVDAALPQSNRSVVDDVIWTANARQAAAMGARRYVNPRLEQNRAPRPPGGAATALDED